MKHPPPFALALLPLALLPVLAFGTTKSAQTKPAQFDPAMLIALPNQPAIDLSRFNQSGAIGAGNYRLDVYVNGNWQGLADVLYMDDDNDPNQNAKLCIKDDLLAKLPLKPEITKKVAKSPKTNCYNLTVAIPNMQTVLDMATMRIDISLPQAFVQEPTDDDTNPTNWNQGINSLFANYQYNHYRSNHTNNTYENHLGLTIGANVHNWHFRHHGFAKNTQTQNTHYHTLNSYVTTAIPTLKSQLTLGDFFTDGALFEGNAMRGVQIVSDNRMLPASQQGYAPHIRGIANSNAKVSIFQNNQEIYQTSVPAGAFNLTNIKDIGGNGDLTVVITEADGTQTKHTIPYHNSITLLRPNRYRYTYAFGRARHHNTKLYQDHLLTGTWQHGINNHWTVNAGVLHTPHYRSFLLGSAFNTPIGAFSFNGTSTNYALYGQNFKHGHQLRLQYHRHIPTTHTNLHASFWWYDNYQPIETALQSHHTKTNNLLPQPKHRYQVSISQPLGNRLGSIYGFFGRTTNQENTHQDQWQLGYNNRFGILSYGISAQNIKTNGKWDKQFLLNASLPLGDASRHHLDSFITHHQDTTQVQTGLFGGFENLPEAHYGVYLNQTDHNKPSWSAHAHYQSPFVKLSSQYGHYQTIRQYAFGASGGIVWHKGGMTASSPLGDTFAIVALPNGMGASLDAVHRPTFNKKGYAILPTLTPYRQNPVTINPEGLPYEVQLTESSKTIIPTANASVFVKFESTIGHATLLTIKFANGDYPPIGTTVYDEQKTAIGFVAQDGRVFLQNGKDRQTLTLQLATGQCQFTYQLPNAKPATPVRQTQAVCR